MEVNSKPRGLGRGIVVGHVLRYNHAHHTCGAVEVAHLGCLACGEVNGVEACVGRSVDSRPVEDIVALVYLSGLCIVGGACLVGHGERQTCSPHEGFGAVVGTYLVEVAVCGNAVKHVFARHAEGHKLVGGIADGGACLGGIVHLAPLHSAQVRLVELAIDRAIGSIGGFQGHKLAVVVWHGAALVGQLLPR